MQAHELLKSWHELQADSSERLEDIPWLAPRAKIGPGNNPITVDANGQFESTVLFQQGEYPTWKSWDLTNLTQKWVTTPSSNNGVILWVTNEDVNAYDLRFYSSENETKPPELMIIWSNQPKTVYFLKDHLGSVRATVLDSAGAPVVAYDDYDPWGYLLAGRTKKRTWSDSQAVAKNKFTGKEWDDDYGVNWFHSPWRPYDPEIARWLILDPAAKEFPSWSPYNYSLNNPLKYVDRDGRVPILIIGAALAGAFIADAIFANPANAPSPRDAAEGNVFQGKSDTQFAVEQGIGVGFGIGAKLLGRAVGALGRNLSDDAANTVAKLTNTGGDIAEITGKELSTSAGDDVAAMSGMLRDAAKGKGNFGIGSTTAEQADAMGKARVGPNYKVASDGKTLISADGTRQYRPPSYKPNLKKVQANFERKIPGQRSKQWQSNAHLDIIEEGNQ